MKKFIQFVFGTTYRALIFFALALVAGKLLLALKGVGALTVPIDRSQELHAGTRSAVAGDDVGVVFLVKDGFGISDSVTLEVNEVGAPKILTGVGSLEPIQEDFRPIVQSRYVRIEGVKLQKFSRSDYVVMGKGAGGKVSGSVKIGSEDTGTGVFLTRTEFYFICGMFLVLGIVIGWFIYYLSVGKKKAAKKFITEVGSSALSDPLL